MGLVELRRVKRGLEELIFYIISHTTASAGFILACSGTRLRAGACRLLEQQALAPPLLTHQ